MSTSAIGVSTRRPRISPLRYPGGKSALYSRLRKMIRDMDLAGCTYVEPYAGGVGAGLSLLVTGQVEIGLEHLLFELLQSHALRPSL